MSYFCTLQSIYESTNNNVETYNDSGVDTSRSDVVPLCEGSAPSVHRRESLTALFPSVLHRRLNK